MNYNPLDDVFELLGELLAGLIKAVMDLDFRLGCILLAVVIFLIVLAVG